MAFILIFAKQTFANTILTNNRYSKKKLDFMEL